MTIPFILKKYKSATVENATKISELSSEQIDKISGAFGSSGSVTSTAHQSCGSGGCITDVQTDDYQDGPIDCTASIFRF